MSGREILQIAFVIGGLVFLFAAIIGGKVSIWKFLDVNVPALSIRARILAAVAGVIFLVVGVGIDSSFWERGRSDSTTTVKKRTPSPIPKSKLPMATQEGNYFYDDFTSQQLRKEEWDIFEPDDKMWSLNSKHAKLQIHTQKGCIWGTGKGLRNQFILKEELPKENFEIVVKLAFQIQAQSNYASVGLFQNHDNFLIIRFGGESRGGNAIWRDLYFVKEQKGKLYGSSRIEKGYGPANSPEILFVKIERIGVRYNGYYSFVETKPPDRIDDIRWSPIGTHVWQDFKGRLSLWADNGCSGATPAVAEFDLVLIRKK